MRNEQRYDKNDLFQEYPDPLAHRHHRIDVSEHMHPSSRPLRLIEEKQREQRRPARMATPQAYRERCNRQRVDSSSKRSNQSR